MTTGTYTYARAVVQQDNLSFTRYVDLPVKTDCGSNLPPGINDTACGGWNGQLCGNDQFYVQPVMVTDKIHLQFKFVNDWDDASGISQGVWKDSDILITDPWLIRAEIVDLQGAMLDDVLENFASEWVSARNNDLIDYQNIVIDVANVTTDNKCFAIKIIHKFANGTTETFYTEPFGILEECQNSFVLEGTFKTRDFASNIYTEGNQYVGTSNLKHRAISRFMGGYEKAEIKIDKKLNDSGYVTSITKDEIYNYFMTQIPPYEVEKLATILSGIELYVDGVLHQDVSGIKKDNDASRMWRPKFTSTKKPNDPNANPASSCI